MPRAKSLIETARRARLEAVKAKAPALSREEMCLAIAKLGVRKAHVTAVKAKIEEAFEHYQLEMDGFPSWGEKLGNVGEMLQAAKRLQRLIRSMPSEERQSGACITSRELWNLRRGAKVPVEVVANCLVSALERRQFNLKTRARGKPDKSDLLCRLMRDLQAIYRQYVPDCETDETALRRRDDWIWLVLSAAKVKCPDPEVHPGKFRKHLLLPQAARA